MAAIKKKGDKLIMLSNRISVTLCVMLLMGEVAWAQPVTPRQVMKAGKNIQKTVQNTNRSFEEVLRTSGQAYIIPDIRISSRPFPKPDEDLAVEKYRRNSLSSRQKLHYKLSSSYANQIREQVKESIYPGHADDFPAEWAEREKLTDQISLPGGWSVILESAYGREKTRFSGHFVSTFREVLALQDVSGKEWVSATEALEKAFEEAQKVKSGFFVIVVKETPEYAQDILILDLDKQRLISMNKSREEIKEGVGTVPTENGEYHYTIPSLGGKGYLEVPGAKTVEEAAEIENLYWEVSKHHPLIPDSEIKMMQRAIESGGPVSEIRTMASTYMERVRIFQQATTHSREWGKELRWIEKSFKEEKPTEKIATVYAALAEEQRLLKRAKEINPRLEDELNVIMDNAYKAETPLPEVLSILKETYEPKLNLLQEIFQTGSKAPVVANTPSGFVIAVREGKMTFAQSLLPDKMIQQRTYTVIEAPGARTAEEAQEMARLLNRIYHRYKTNLVSLAQLQDLHTRVKQGASLQQVRAAAGITLDGTYQIFTGEGYVEAPSVRTEEQAEKLEEMVLRAYNLKEALNKQYREWDSDKEITKAEENYARLVSTIKKGGTFSTYSTTGWAFPDDSEQRATVAPGARTFTEAHKMQILLNQENKMIEETENIIKGYDKTLAEHYDFSTHQALRAAQEKLARQKEDYKKLYRLIKNGGTLEEVTEIYKKFGTGSK